MKKLYVLVFLIVSISGFSQENDTIPKNQLQEIVISSFHINDSLMNAPASIGIISATDLVRNNTSDITPAINMVSGVLMQSGAYNTNRISIRGIGARTPYGTNKIRAFYGNIPLTSGDSETTIEDLNVENIEQIEIIKGPLSSLYGAGLGGAILLTPKTNSRTKAGFSTTYGSFGLMKSNVSLNLIGKTSSININYHKLETDGWRQNSAYDREGVTIAGELFRKGKSKLSYLANYTYMKAFIPSSINKEMFDNNPKAAAPTWLASKGFEQYDSYLAGLNYDFTLFGSIKNSTSVFLNAKKSNEPRPFDILKQNNQAHGARTQFSGSFETFKMKSEFIVGAEYFRDGFDGGTFENLYQQNNGLGSLQGNRITTIDQNRNFYNAFAQLRFQLSKKLELQTGLNVNKTEFNLKNIFPTENSSSDKYSYDAIWSPQFSLLFKPNSEQTIYASASRGFSLPSVEETLTANGTINSEIKPESGYNFEIGGKFYFLNRHLYSEASIYRMQIRDLLVARRVGDDQYIGLNAGETLHQGVETTLNYNTNIGKTITVNVYVSGSIGEYKFKDFNDNGNDFSGNKLTGVPNSKVNSGITLSRSGFYFSGDFQFMDKLPINDANTVYNDAYHTLNLKTGYRFAVFQNMDAHFSAGVNNVTDEKYAAMVLVNATAVGNNTPRFYYPGMPVNYYGSVAFSYLF